MNPDGEPDTVTLENSKPDNSASQELTKCSMCGKPTAQKACSPLPGASNLFVCYDCRDNRHITRTTLNNAISGVSSKSKSPNIKTDKSTKSIGNQTKTSMDTTNMSYLPCPPSHSTMIQPSEITPIDPTQTLSSARNTQDSSSTHSQGNLAKNLRRISEPTQSSTNQTTINRFNTESHIQSTNEEPRTSNLNSSENNVLLKVPSHINKSSDHRSRASSRAERALRALKEEQALAQKHLEIRLREQEKLDQEFLRRRLQIDQSQFDSDDSVISDQEKNDSLRRWVDTGNTSPLQNQQSATNQLFQDFNTDICSLPQTAKSLPNPSNSNINNKNIPKPSTSNLKTDSMYQNQDQLHSQFANFTLNTTTPTTIEPQKSVSWLQAKNQSEFLNATKLNVPDIDNERNLTSMQIAARHVVDKSLPTFDGSAARWPVFISQYINTTNTCGYTQAENLARLSKALTGKALASVSGYLTIPENVPMILNTLRMLFGRPEVILSALIKEVENQPKHDDLNSDPQIRLQSIIQFGISVQNLCATMETAGLVAHMNNPTLLQQLVGKLPMSLQLEWGMQKRLEANTNIKSFATWLYHKAEAASEVVVTEPIKFNTKSSNKHQTQHKNNSTFFGTHNFTEPIIPKPHSQNLYCIVCRRNNHNITDCNKFNRFSVSKRWSFIINMRLCAMCFGRHPSKYCNNKITCMINNCGRPHHKLMHKDRNTEQQPETASKPEPIKNSSEVVNVHTSKRNQIYYQILPVMLRNPNNNKTIRTFAFLDTGANVSMIDSDLADELQLHGPKKSLCLVWTSNITKEVPNSHAVTLEISPYNNQHQAYKMTDVRTVPDLRLPIQSLNIDESQRKYLSGINLSEYMNAKPKLLIGLKDWNLLTTLEVREGNPGQPTALRTRLGWTLVGGSYETNSNTAVVNYHNETDEAQNIDDLIKFYFSIESLGIKVTSQLKHVDEERAIQILNDTVRYKNTGHYEAGLLWKTNELSLPPSYDMALKRLIGLERRLSKNNNIKNAMNQLIINYLEKGYIREASDDEIRTPHKRVWYLPIFPVVNKNKPGKFRVVWDAAAKSHGVSLNSALLSGPDLLNNLAEILMKFREKAIAITADVIEMFHQVEIRSEDQQAQRFLWRQSPNDKPTTYIMKVMTFGATCSPCIAHFVKNKNAKQWEDKYPRAVKAIIERHYVDDWIDGFDSTSECLRIAKNVIEIHKHAGFSLQRFLSNDRQVSLLLNENKPITNSTPLTLAEIPKVLGIWWETNEDVFCFRLNKDNIDGDLLFGNRYPTKREVLRIVMSVYDPLGLISFFTIEGKSLIQRIWRTNCDWDDQIKETEYVSWRQWVEKLYNIESIRIPRCYFQESSSNLELHTFVDASETAMIAMCYIRILYHDKIDVRLISAKSKVAPNKPLTIPRLELQAALIGARLANTVSSSHEIKFKTKYYWSDSRNVLYWIKSDPRRFKQYVSFRIAEITDLSTSDQWRWVPTNKNCADEATRISKNSSTKNIVSAQWFHGPEFLYQPSENWPTDTLFEKDNVDSTDVECKRVSLHNQRDIIMIDAERFSSWNKLVNTMSYILRFFHWSKQKIKGPLSSKEIEEAEKHIFRQAQLEQYEDEYKIISHGQQVKKNSNIYIYSPFLDENGLLRSRTRLELCEHLDYSMKFPIILPPKHQITKLLIYYYHKKYQHQNHESVVNDIRQRYVIAKLRTTVKRIRNACQICKLKALKFQHPEMAPLPICRTAVLSRPFTYCGVDYFGPMNVVVGRRTEKRWGVLYTCLTIRAIHIEIAHSLTTNSFIMSFKNFMARRGVPKVMYSDNGTNFVGANNELEKLAKDQLPDEYRQQFANIEWNFNPPNAPHMGGAWERLVQSVKRGLKASLPTRTPNDELLRCCLMEVEAIVNARPLTYNPEHKDIPEALTPNHFLLGSSNGEKPLAQFNEDVYILKNNWKIAQKVAEIFWKRFTREYLPYIARRNKWYEKTTPIKEGDVVAIILSDIPNSWSYGRVQKTIPGKDGQIRKAIVNTSSGKFCRPVNKIALLEIKSGNGEAI